MFSSLVHQITSFEVFFFFFQTCLLPIKGRQCESYTPLLRAVYWNSPQSYLPMCGSHVRNLSHNLWEQNPKRLYIRNLLWNKQVVFVFVFFLLAVWLTFVSYSSTFWISLSKKVLLCMKGQTHLWLWLPSLKSTESFLVCHWVTDVVSRLPDHSPIRVNEKLLTQSIIL